MAIDRVRHGRQIRLPEIGDAGQERLDAGVVVLGGRDDAREIEASYLSRAGVRVRENGDTRANADVDAAAKKTLAALAMKDSAARDVAEGALRALLAMRKILGIEGAG